MLYTAYIGVDVSWPLLQLLCDVNGPPARKADNNLRRVSRTIGQVRAVQLNSPCNLYSEVGKNPSNYNNGTTMENLCHMSWPQS